MKSLIVIIIFALVTLAFFYDVIVGPNLFLNTNPINYDPWRSYVSGQDLVGKEYFPDPFLTYLPRRVFLSESINSGRLPLWNPYVFGGTPFLADPQTRVFYPIELLLTRVDPTRAMGYDFAIHVFIAMLGMYLFLRAVGVTRAGALLGGCTYAFSSFFYFRYGFPTLAASASWIPFFFYGFEVAWQSAQKGILLLTGSFALGYLAGFPQVFLLGVGAVVFYGFYISIHNSPGKRRSSVARVGRIFGTAGLLSVLLVSVQLIPLVELYRNSLGLEYPLEYVLTVFVAPPITLLRSIFPGFFGNPLEGTDWSDFPRELIHQYHPDFVVYCGAGALMLAIVSVLAIRKSPRIRALLILLALSIGVAVSVHLLRIGYALLPVFRASRADRVSVLACFALATMAGFGFSMIERDRTAMRRVVAAVLIAVVAFTLVSAIVFEIKGASLITRLAEKAREMPDEHWSAIVNRTRSGKIKAWAEQNPAAWMAYEKKQLRRGVFTVILSAALILVWALLGSDRRKLRWALGCALILFISMDVTTTAKTYYTSYTSQARGGCWETEGIGRLKYAVGEEGRWRIRTLQNVPDDMPVFPHNTNLLFGLYSVDGRSTVRTRSYAVLKKNRDEVEDAAGRPLGVRRWIAGDLDDLMGVRFLIARKGESRFESTRGWKSIVLAEESPGRLGMLNLGDESRLALVQEPGETLTFEISPAPARMLHFDVGFDCPDLPGDSVFFTLTCEGKANTVHYQGGFDLHRDRGEWHSGSMDLSPLRGNSAHITASVTSSGPDRQGSIMAGWSRFEYPVKERPVRQIADGYALDIGRRGLALSLVVSSDAAEVPLEIDLDGSRVATRWITFLPGTRSRWITIDLKNLKAGQLQLTSDSTFSITGCRQVWSGWAADLECRLIYDTDMCIYENTGAIEKGICIDKAELVIGDLVETPEFTMESLENLDEARCGTSDLVSYGPEEVVLDVSAERDCYFILQDMYYPGWKAYVDGVETHIFPTHLGVRAIEVPNGIHRVTMVYRPLSFKLGLMLTCLGVVLTVAYAVKSRRSW